MNKTAIKAHYARKESFARLQAASQALTDAINSDDYGTDEYHARVVDAQEAHFDASEAYSMATVDELEAHDIELHEVVCRDGWASMPSFKSYFYDDYVDAALAAIEASQEMIKLIEAGDLPPQATVTLSRADGKQYVWDRNGDLSVQ